MIWPKVREVLSLLFLVGCIVVLLGLVAGVLFAVVVP